ncbi:MAG: hypothetical protein ACLT3W_06530 [Bifidobacterium pseudocatenulatum]
MMFDVASRASSTGVQSVQSYLPRAATTRRGDSKIRGDSNGFASISSAPTSEGEALIAVSEKIDLAEEALNALKDAGLGSNSLRASIRRHQSRLTLAAVSPAGKRNKLQAVTMSGRGMRFPSSTWKNRMEKTI